MSTRSRILVGMTAAAVAALCAAPLLAQQESDEKPKPAARVALPLPDLSGVQQDSDQNDQTWQPDRGPVAGVQSPTLGTSYLRHSYWVPGIQYGSTVSTGQTNSINSTSTPTSGWTPSNYISGNLSLLDAWSHSSLGVNYSGGGFFSSDQGNGQYHQFSSAFELDRRRWQTLVIEQLSYLPQTAFGFGGTTGLSTPGIGGALSVPLPGLQEVFAPGQSVLSVTGPRYSSASAAQLTYAMSRRSTLTVAAVYGLLRFSDPGNVDNDSETLNLGYSYAVTRKDSLGVVYRFTAYHYPGEPQALGDHVTQLMYARRITGRLALNLGGGPEITNFRVPVSFTNQTISGSGIASLSYAFRMSSLRLLYSHGVGNGSGVFTSGSSTDQLTAGWSRPLGRAWSAALNLGFVRNSTIVTVKGLLSPSYNSWLTEAGLNRPLGRTARFSIGYQSQIQVSNGIVCTTAMCQTTQVTHQIQTSFQWNAPPQVLR